MEDTNINYRKRLIETINTLLESEEKLFSSSVYLLLSGELNEIEKVFEVGDEYEFNLNHFKTSDDINVKQMSGLIEKLRVTVDYLMNVNNINENDLLGS